jgi:protein-tyrosine phosphatase
MLVCVTPPLPAGRDPGGPYRVCLVCAGNICRSPMAEVVLRAFLAEAGFADSVTLDSAGTGSWHVDERMNSGARAALARHGYDGSSHRARQFEADWFESRELVLAMDLHNLADLRHMARSDRASVVRVRLFGEVGGLGERTAIPDPYGGTPEDFDHVLDLLESAAPVIVSQLERVLSPRPA